MNAPVTNLDYAKALYVLGLIDEVELEATTERMVRLGVADLPPHGTLPVALNDGPDFDARAKYLGAVRT